MLSRLARARLVNLWYVATQPAARWYWFGSQPTGVEYKSLNLTPQVASTAGLAPSGFLSQSYSPSIARAVDNAVSGSAAQVYTPQVNASAGFSTAGAAGLSYGAQIIAQPTFGIAVPQALSLSPQVSASAILGTGGSVLLAPQAQISSAAGLAASGAVGMTIDSPLQSVMTHAPEGYAGVWLGPQVSGSYDFYKEVIEEGDRDISIDLTPLVLFGVGLELKQFVELAVSPQLRSTAGVGLGFFRSGLIGQNMAGIGTASALSSKGAASVGDGEALNGD